jgi:chromosome segregation ATPase
MKKMDTRLDQHEEDLRKADERIAQNEEGLRVERERIDQNERMIVSLSVKPDDLARSLKSQAEMLGMVLRVLDRIDQKLDDRGQSGKHGHE